MFSSNFLQQFHQIVIEKTKDGRVTRNHLILFDFLIDENINFQGIDSLYKENVTWNERDKNMAETIKKFLSKNKDKKALTVVGNLHARKKKFLMPSVMAEPFVPCRSHFQNSVSIKIRYAEGEINNFGIQKVVDEYAMKVLDEAKQKAVIQKSRSKFFEYNYFVTKTKAAKLVCDEN